jgi:indole-3-glycerol phosphate synthase
VARVSDFLAAMVCGSRARVRKARAREPEADLRNRALATASPPRLELDRFDLIAEVKRRSPSAGRLDEELDAERAVAARAAAYAAAGAAAISVLTEPSAFDGSLAHVAAAARAVRVPVLRKDFLVEPYQVLEARAWGAGGALLIARILDDRMLGEMLDAAGEMGLFVLAEAFDAEDLARIGSALARRAGRLPVLVGLNTRDLETLEVDPRCLETLADAFPKGSTRVAESGTETPEAAARVAALGYQLVLVGTALMRSKKPGRLVASIIAAGRAAGKGSGCVSG